jgi:hypothetical protein
LRHGLLAATEPCIDPLEIPHAFEIALAVMTDVPA